MSDTGDIEIRRMNGQAEAWTCADIMASTDPWVTLSRTRDSTFVTVNSPEGETYVAATPAGEIAALVSIAMRVPLIRGYIVALAVRADYRNRGLGTRLLAFAEERIFRDSPNVFMCVSSFNTDAQRLYQRLGYTQIGEIADFVIPGASEFLLRKTKGPWSQFKKD
jgi:ribosomal protein S18 acetylase RimI-like enzyme